MPTSLVTGGAGFIGSHVAHHLLQLSHDVVILDDLSGGFVDNLPAAAIFAEGSILDTELLDRLFRTYKFTYVYHLAAYAAEGLSHFIKRFNYNNNVIGSVNLITVAKRKQAVALAKTGDTHGAEESYRRARDLSAALPPGSDRDDWLHEADQALRRMPPR